MNDKDMWRLYRSAFLAASVIVILVMVMINLIA
jgi:hypothetical protein